MSCDHSLVETYLFDYIDSTLEPSTARAFEQAIDHCEHCKNLYHSAVTTQQWQRDWKEVPVPDWHRTRFAVSKPKAHGWSWLNGLSLATSTLALLMVLFRVEIINGPTGFTVSFAGKGSQYQVSQLMEERFDELAERQVSYIDNRFEEFNLQQVADHKELVSTVLQYGRDERRQDLNLLMASWLQQRDDDRQKLNQRVDYILDNQIENNRYLNQVLKVSNSKQY